MFWFSQYQIYKILRTRDFVTSLDVHDLAKRGEHNFSLAINRGWLLLDKAVFLSRKLLGRTFYMGNVTLATRNHSLPECSQPGIESRAGPLAIPVGDQCEMTKNWSIICDSERSALDWAFLCLDNGKAQTSKISNYCSILSFANADQRERLLAVSIKGTRSGGGYLTRLAQVSLVFRSRCRLKQDGLVASCLSFLVVILVIAEKNLGFFVKLPPSYGLALKSGNTFSSCGRNPVLSCFSK